MKFYYSLMLSMAAAIAMSASSNADIVVSVDFDPVTAGIQSATSPLSIGDQVTANFVLNMTSASDSLVAYSFDAQFDSSLQFVSRTEPQINGWSQAFLDNQVGPTSAFSFDGNTGGQQNGPFSQIIGTITFTTTQGGSFAVTPGFFFDADHDSFIAGAPNFDDISPSIAFNSGTINVAAVPEPSSMALLATAGIGGWVARRRAARKQAAK